MSKALTLFGDKSLPASSKYDDYFKEHSNIQTGERINALGYEGKVWQITFNGEKQKLVRTDEDGDETPISTMRVVILNHNQRRGRTYYEGSYDPGNPGAPVCWSDDGERPDPSVEKPQAATCAGCPMAEKGSRITDQGKSVAACSQHRMLAVLPEMWIGKETAKPLRLKIAVTSDYDKENKEQEAKQFFAYKQFLNYITAHGAKHTGQIVTKMKFDPNVAYPKLLFGAERPLQEHELDFVVPLFEAEETKALLAGTYTPAGVDGTKIDRDNEASSASEGTKVKDVEIVDADEEEEAPKPKPKTKSPSKPKANGKAKTMDVEDAVEVEADDSHNDAQSVSGDDDDAALAALLNEWTD